MRKQSSITFGLAVLGLLLLSTMVLAASPLSLDAESADFSLLNGAFDEWDGDVPKYWKVYRGNADDYGAHTIPISDATNEVANHAFFFQIINDEIKENRNAYLYQELMLPPGSYSLHARTVIYGANAGFYRSGSAVTLDAYTYMAYYALVPRADVMLGGSFVPELVSDDDWKELWLYSTVCNEKVKSVCDDVERAEMVPVDTGDKYVFILRAQIKWPDWRASARYIFDDLHIIPAEPSEDNGNGCVTTECLEGKVKP